MNENNKTINLSSNLYTHDDAEITSSCNQDNNEKEILYPRGNSKAPIVTKNLSDEDIAKIRASEILKNKSEEEINQMSDEEIEQLATLLFDNKSEEFQKMSDLPSNNSVLKNPSKEYIDSIKDSKEKYEDVAMDGTIRTDPLTGQKTVELNKEEQNKIDMTIDRIMNQDLNTIDEDKLLAGVSSIMGTDITESEIVEVVSFIKRVSSKEIPTDEVYDLAPKFIKDLVIYSDQDATKSLDKKQINELTCTVIDMIKSEFETDMSFIELEDVINNEINSPDIMNMYLDHIQEVMEIDLMKQADEIEKEDPDKAKLMREMSVAFTDAYEYSTLINKIKNKRKIINKELTKELKNYDKLCKKFNSMYKPSKFVITDIRTLVFILDRHLSKSIDIDSIKKFIILMIKVFRNKDINNLAHHTLMYYTTKLIEALDYTDSDSCELSDIIKANIEEVIFLIEE